MPKLRKMLGAADSPYIVSLMRLIETQSKATIARWCAEYAFNVVLPIYEKHIPGDDRPRRILQAAIDCANGKVKFAHVKNIRATEWTKPPQLESNPIAMAAARAIIDTSCMVWQTPTHSLGFCFYAAAAIAYDRVGLEEKPEVYDLIAAEECAKMEAALRAVAVENEPNPAKINWSC